MNVSNATPAHPYTNWATAAVSLHVAVGVASNGDTVLVTNGTYLLTNMVYLTNGIVVQSVNGPWSTIVDGALTTCCFRLEHSNAVVQGVTITRGKDRGVVIYRKGTLRNCIVTANVAYYVGTATGVYCYQGGLVQNCLIYSNVSYAGIAKGGGVALDLGGTVENCTITGNRGTQTMRGGGVYCNGSSGVVRNCIIYGNFGEYPNHYETSSGWSYSYSCTTPSIAGVGNLSSDPQFVDPAALNFHLKTNSPCMDTGTNLPWMADTSDLDGVPRRIGYADMGAFETGNWFCVFMPTIGTGIDQLKVVFTSELLGKDSGAMHYWWDLDGDGTTDQQGVGLSVVTNLYPSNGMYRVRLTVTNALAQGASHTEILALPAPRVFTVAPVEGGAPLTSVFTAIPEIAATPGLYYSWDLDGDGTTDVSGIGRAVVTNVYSSLGVFSPAATVSNLTGQVLREVKNAGIHTYPLVRYVSPTGSEQYPYSNWATAARSIPTALNNAFGGIEVVVTNGTYVLLNTVILQTNVWVHSVGGPWNTVVDGNQGLRCFQLQHPDAVVEGFTICRGYAIQGGGIYFDHAGTVKNCVVTRNAAYVGGGAYFNGGGKLRNCLVSSNSANGDAGGIIMLRGGTVENCTVVENQAGSEGGGMYCDQGGGVFNTIVFSNTASMFPNLVGFAAETNEPWYERVVTSDPQFIDGVLGKYHLMEKSSCVNGGVNQDWMPPARDLDGMPRLAGSAVDIGVYEFQNLNFDFAASPSRGAAPLAVTLTAIPAFTNAAGWHFAWDFNADGLFETQGVDLAVVTNVYNVGSHSVRLAVRTPDGETATLTRPNFVFVAPAVVYVSSVGLSLSPYTNWATAARSIGAALSVASDGTLVLVSNGTYTLSAAIAITNGATVRSVNGPAMTTVSGNNSVRCFFLNHANARVEGFRLILGKADSGGGARVDFGLLQNCVVVSNKARVGSGVMCSSGGTVRNCLVVDNHGESMNSTSWAGGIHNVGQVENCTIVSNSAHKGGGLIAERGGTTRNTIIVNNSASLEGPNWAPYLGDGGSLAFTCTTPRPAGPGNLEMDPAFLDAATGDFRLGPASACVNAGTNQLWMTSAVDLFGRPRIAYGIVDLGAFEVSPASLLVQGNPAAYGTPQPFGYGSHDFPAGSILSNTVPDYVPVESGTRAVCQGWVWNGTGPVSGSTTAAVVTLLSDSSLSWLWGREFWLHLPANGGSILGASSGWIPEGTDLELSPFNAYGYAFHHWEVDAADAGTAIPLSLKMEASHTVSAIFTHSILNENTNVAPIKINCGGKKVEDWVKDRGCINGSVVTGSREIGWTLNTPQAVWQSCRIGPRLVYSFPALSNGLYQVRLYFAELQDKKAGERLFKVKIEGVTVLPRLDVCARAGGRYRSLREAFLVNVADGNGMQIAGIGWNGQDAFFNGIEITPLPCPGMALIPAGSFEMGNAFPSEGDADEHPVHSVAVRSFFIDKREVTQARWAGVRSWGVWNGYDDLPPGSAKAPDHPVHTINWFDVVKWCNARSEKEGRMPVYYTDSTLTNVYRSGQCAPFVKWPANGYRLPTEAEWEKAARGGKPNSRFPWGDSITHLRANYFSAGDVDYDQSLIGGYDSRYQVGGLPYTSPAGDFRENEYGLYDVAGNVREWCWDWYGASYYEVAPSTDPWGPAEGQFRVTRGGAWKDDAPLCRVASRGARSSPEEANTMTGFRTVLAPVPSR